MIQMLGAVVRGPFSLHHTGKVTTGHWLYLKKRDQWLGVEVPQNTHNLILSVAKTSNASSKRPYQGLFINPHLSGSLTLGGVRIRSPARKFKSLDLIQFRGGHQYKIYFFCTCFFVLLILSWSGF